MKLTLNSGKTLTVTAKEGDKEANWYPSGNHYKVTVRLGSRRFSFDFWDSFANMQKGEPCDLRGAVASWASDVFAGLNATSADDIASEFGYENPSEALRVFKGVKKAEKQFTRIGMLEEDLQGLADY